MTEGKQNKYLTIVAALFLVGFTFYILKELQAILLPFFIALVISFLFEPYYEWLKSKKIPGAISLVIVIITILILANIASVFVFTSINAFTIEIPKYTEKSTRIVESISVNLGNWDIYNRYFKDSFNLSKILNGQAIATFATSFFSSIISLFGNFVLILIYVIFLLSEFGSIRIRILKAFSSDKSRKITDALTDIFKDVKKYIVGKTLINLSYGTLVTLILWIFGVDFFIVWGFLAFLMAYIPNIGSLISIVLPFTTALIQFDGDFTRPLIILILMVVSANLIGNIVEPKILGDKLNLSPILLLLSLIFWGYLWGLIGMILSVPIMSMIKIILGKFESTKPISILMSLNVTGSKSG
ncbi:MAG: AI-2E family transporter [Ignavibacteria bacterium]|jgi:predicted PurR-regulated permease PerM